VQRKGLPDVVFAGYVPDEDVPRYYRTADIYCAPNTGNESFGLVLVEAMACGTAIVASNIEGFADVVTHGVHGLLATPEDENAIAAALLQLIKNPSLREEMARQGRNRAQEFGWESISGRILSYYERVASEKGAAIAAQIEPREAPV
jgi:phosphatidylinositol alpha-mannosyltransferase